MRRSVRFRDEARWDGLGSTSLGWFGPFSVVYCALRAVSAPPLVLYGASGYSLALAELFETWIPDPLARVVAYIDDDRGEDRLSIAGAPIISFDTWKSTYPEIPMFVTIGNPASRRKLVDRVRAAGGRFSSFYRSAGNVARDIVVGEGTMILDYANVGAGTTLGNHVHVMPLASIDENCTVGDFTTFCPMSAVSGHVVIEEGVFIGVGARIVNQTDEVMTIGVGATIAAGAVVLRSVLPGETLVGNPATDFRSLAKQRSA